MRVGMGCTVMLGAVMAVGGAGAQVPKASSGQQNHALDKVTQAEGSPDQVFLKKAIEGNHGEIGAAKLALKKSKNEQVKQYAQRMLDDHTKMLADLHGVEQGQALKYQDTPSPMGAGLRRKLMGLRGAAFDKAYIDGMVTDHEEDVKEFTEEAETGRNAAIKGAAEKSLPVIKEHLGMVQGLQKAIG
jgi:putative membrane protein